MKYFPTVQSGLVSASAPVPPKAMAAAQSQPYTKPAKDITPAETGRISYLPPMPHAGYQQWGINE